MYFLTLKKGRVSDQSIWVQNYWKVYIKTWNFIFHFSLRHQIPDHSLHLPLATLLLGGNFLIELMRQVSILIKVHGASSAEHEGRSSEAPDGLAGSLHVHGHVIWGRATEGEGVGNLGCYLGACLSHGWLWLLDCPSVPFNWFNLSSSEQV